MVAAMPNKRIEKARVPRVVGSDKRMKLSPEDKDEIRVLRGEGYTLSAIAEHFGVSKKLIHLITSPTAREKAAQYRQDVGWRHYYDKTKHAAYMKSHREHKRKFT
jgi:predicted transposase YbfD/YdcC